jgi:hypothetical protein
MNQVDGQRSPRWALWSRMTIPCENGLMYLARLRIIQTPWFGIYLHDIYEPDAARDPHNHPWSFVSIVLRGSYTELLWPDAEHAWWIVRQTHRRWSIHRMSRQSAHRIAYAAPGLKTLILTGPRRSNWGFFTPAGFVPWQQYEGDL